MGRETWNFLSLRWEIYEMLIYSLLFFYLWKVNRILSHSVPKGPKSGKLKTRKGRASLKTRKGRTSFKTRKGLVQGLRFILIMTIFFVADKPLTG
jgi:hypothetical protein